MPCGTAVVPFARRNWVLLAAIGLFSSIAQHLLTESVRNASPSVVAPFEYTALLWGIIIDRVVWGVFPSSRVYIGGVFDRQRSVPDLAAALHARAAHRFGDGSSYDAALNEARPNDGDLFDDGSRSLSALEHPPFGGDGSGK